ncbi:MAG: peptide-methionine (R)-S-oxide reductase [Armatimonadetes bacterium 55-13]|nr:peptide-methionine (R)-S-oxide reductase MsrB [Armatimonadota bacterium]ODU51782.1 MAG: peptide-methionine (R)-S-oxide reductase [bacterium SCN 57-13]OJU64745.1 MAG: peptide-methionine (R)-S-oxide reductase [Armatimonadetes bacterium 55-13]
MKLFLLGLAVVAVLGFAFSNQSSRASQTPPTTDGRLEGSPKRADKVVKTDAEWKKILTEAQYKILRNHGTEAAFCGRFYDNHKKGVYLCAGCKLPLFRSDAKFDSGTGWPSFFQPYAKDSIWTREDNSYGMHRTEVLCARCDGHLGHVFDDGPRDKGGLRYCMNSDAFIFKEDGK